MADHIATGLTPHGTYLVELHDPDTDAGQAQIEQIERVISSDALGYRAVGERWSMPKARAVLDALRGDQS